jgi:hypothetical protein
VLVRVLFGIPRIHGYAVEKLGSEQVDLRFMWFQTVQWEDTFSFEERNETRVRLLLGA